MPSIMAKVFDCDRREDTGNWAFADHSHHNHAEVEVLVVETPLDEQNNDDLDAKEKSENCLELVVVEKGWPDDSDASVSETAYRTCDWEELIIANFGLAHLLVCSDNVETKENIGISDEENGPKFSTLEDVLHLSYFFIVLTVVFWRELRIFVFSVLSQ